MRRSSAKRDWCQPGGPGNKHAHRGVVRCFSLAVLVFNPTRADAIDWSKVGTALGKAASVQGEVHRYGLPRSGLHVTLDGVEIKASVGPLRAGGMIMLDQKTLETIVGLGGTVTDGVLKSPRRATIRG
jgi:hypothetical protein